MKVLYLITLAERGGGQVHVADLLRGYRGRFEVELGTGEEGYLTDEARSLGIPVHVIPDLVHAVDPRRDARAIRAVARLIHRRRPSLVHAHTSKAGIVGRAAARMAGVPAVFTAHTWAFAEGVSWRRRLIGIPSEWLASRISARIIAVSEANRALALRYYVAPRSRITVVHNGIPDTALRAAPGAASVPQIVMVARFAEQKDQMLLVEALAGVDLPFRLALVGDGPRRAEVEATAHTLGLDGRVDFLGERDDVAAILARSSVFVLASNWEGFPLSTLEAMRAGLPVIASDVGGTAEAITEGVTGYVVRQHDRAGLRDRLTALLRDPLLRARMGAAGRRRYATEFTLAHMLDRTAAIYEEAISQMRGGSQKATDMARTMADAAAPHPRARSA
jgi:glycosyltransferase involved in cell wall biosynthesis